MNRLAPVERNHYLLLQFGIRSFYELGILNFELGVVLGFACDLELNIFELLWNANFQKLSINLPRILFSSTYIFIFA